LVGVSITPGSGILAALLTASTMVTSAPVRNRGGIRGTSSSPSPCQLISWILHRYHKW